MKKLVATAALASLLVLAGCAQGTASPSAETSPASVSSAATSNQSPDASDASGGQSQAPSAETPTAVASSAASAESGASPQSGAASAEHVDSFAIGVGDTQLVVTLADYCRKAGLGEEACVKRTLWLSRVRLSEDVVRKIFRAAYAKPYEGKLISQMNEKERVARTIREFMTRRYQLRYNEIKQMVEFRLNDQTYQPWQPLTDRDQKRIAFEEMLEGGHGWSMDIELYVHSSMVPTYNPILEFLGGVGKWDGKHDYIEDFARRLKTDYDRWPHFFHRWFLAMVAQALNKSRDYGNSVVPLLIGPQALKKSSFCRNILPYALREYYMDDIKLDNPEQVERVLSRMWLVNIEEYNAKTEREQAKIKRLLTEKDVQVRKMRSDQYVMKPRLCSFIATTNDSQPLTDPTGSRRYLCVEVTGQADMSGTINYRQMYAQALAELERGDIYWFTNEDEQEITQHNQRHQLMTSVDEILSSLYLPAEHHREFL